MGILAKDPLLDIRGLSVGYQRNGRAFEAVRDVSLQVERGEILGLVGESGSGKTSLALALLRYLPPEGSITGGEIWFDGRDLSLLGGAELRRFWGTEVAFVPQDPPSSLNPSMRIGEQLSESMPTRQRLSQKETRSQTLELLQRVRLADPERVADRFPHQISAGMQQRVLIAMALAGRPKLLVLDEPTSNLDATTQMVILDLIRDLIGEHGATALYVTHNLGVVAQICDRVAVLYAGEVVELAPTRALYHRPLHPYSQGLLRSVPRLGETKNQVALSAMPGRIPDPEDLPPGCIFQPRCPFVVEGCHEKQQLFGATSSRAVRCHRWETIQSEQGSIAEPASKREEAQARSRVAETTLELQGVRVHFPQRRSLLDWVAGRAVTPVRAVDGVGLSIRRGDVVGLVGESGSGKTTLVRAVLGLIEPTEGELRLFNASLPPRLDQRDLATLRLMQMVFQDPQEALNPYQSVGEIIGRPLIRLGGLSRSQARQRAEELLDAVQLSSAFAGRMPGKLSGGEKQRVAIARAFASDPSLLIADEAVSGLDVSVQASILNLLQSLQGKQDNAVLFISHDLAVVAHVSDQIAVIYLGRLMEWTPAESLLEPPYHPYTEALLSAIPLMDPDAEQVQLRLEGEVPSPVDVPGGCPFHTRCPRFLGEICVQEEPPWRTTASGKGYFCHIEEEHLLRAQERVVQFSYAREG
jgi:peptide/nickel transport system ATP-binding protein